MYFQSANLTDANLTGANLEGANLKVNFMRQHAFPGEGESHLNADLIN